MATINELSFTDDRAELAERFNWVIGPVFAAYMLADSDRVILVQGAKSFAVVAEQSRLYMGCCPSLNHALKLIDR
jgi:hypothetical protein